MIAWESLLIVACLALASYALSILLLYKNKDRLEKTKERSGKPFALRKQFPTSTKNQKDY